MFGAMAKMVNVKITQKEYELDKWVDNEDDEYESNFYDDIEFEDMR